MIRIVNKKFQIPVNEKCIGCVGDNETTFRKFIINRYDGDIDLSIYTPVIEVEPINKSELSYYDILEVDVTNDTIILGWTIKTHNLKNDGRLLFNIWFGYPTKKNSTKVWQSYIDYFEVKKGIDAKNSGNIIPPSIFEQAVIEATKQANLSRQYAQSISNDIGNLNDLPTYDKSSVVSAITELYNNYKRINDIFTYIENSGSEILLVKKDNVV